MSGEPRPKQGLPAPKGQRQRLKPMSAKRRGESAARKALRLRVIERDRARCIPKAKGAPGGCWHPPGLIPDVHEIVSRGRWAEGYLIDENCMTTCRAHHDWITFPPSAEAHRQAYDLGLLARRPR